MKPLNIIVILLLSFSSLNAQNYKDLLTEVKHSENDSIKLMYLFEAASKVHNIHEHFQLSPHIFSLVTKKYLDPAPYLIKSKKIRYTSPTARIHFRRFRRKHFFSFETYKKLQKKAPNSISKAFLGFIGLDYAYWGKTSKVTKIAEMLLEEDAQSPIPYLILGQLYFHSPRKSDQGVANYNKVLELDSTNYFVSKELAVKLAMESTWFDVSEYSTEYIMLPTPSTYKDKDSLSVQNNLRKAIVHIDNALKFDPSNSSYLKLKGDFLFATFKKEEALEVYIKAIQIDSNYLAIRRVISIYRENRAYQKGIDLYTKYLESYHTLEFKIGRAYLYYLQKDYTKSLEELNSIAIEDHYLTRETLVRTHKYLKGANYARTKQYLKAMNHLEDLDAPYYWGPLGEEFYFILALLYSKQGDVPKKAALQLLELALFHDINNPEYLALKAKLEQMD